MTRSNFSRALLGTTALVAVVIIIPKQVWADPIVVSTSEASVINADTITATQTALTVSGTGSIGTLTNTGTLSGTNRGAYLTLGAHADSIVNSGLIAAGTLGSMAAGGIANGGTIGSVTNTATGTIISNHSSGIGNNYSSSYIGALTNNGLISGVTGGVWNDGTFGQIINTGVISGQQSGINANSGTISTIDNSGTIVGGSIGISLGSASQMGTLINSSTGIIKGPIALSISSGGSIGGISNAGVIAGIIKNSSANALSFTGGTGGDTGTLTGANLTNQGSIINTLSNLTFAGGNLLLNSNINATGHTVSNTGANLSINSAISVAGAFTQSFGTLQIDPNSGGLTVSGAVAITGGTVQSNLLSTGNYLAGNRTLVSGSSLDLTGAILSVNTVTGLSRSVSTIGNNVTLSINNDYVGGTLSTLDNSLSLTSASTGLYVATTGRIDAVTNSGTFGGAQFGVNNRGTIGTFTNSGLVTNANFTALWNQGSIGQLVNTGTISNSSWAILNSNTISTLTNSGLIHGAGNAIQNNGRIDVLDNSGTMSGGSNAIAGNFGTLINSGVIKGNINQNGGTIGTIIGGSNGTVGTLTGYSVGTQGTIGVSSDLTFASGALVLNDKVTAVGAAPSAVTVRNTGADITLTNSVNVDANFSQTGGSLNLGTTGKLVVTQAASLTGGTVVSGAVSSSSTYRKGDTGATLVAGGAGSSYAGVNVSIAGAFSGLSATSSVSGNNLLLAIGNDYIGDTQATITNSQTISGVSYPLYVANSGSIGTYSNSGQLIGTVDGASNNGSIGSFTNSGLISGAQKGFGNQSTITNLTNTATGTILGGTAAGLQNDTSMGTITNAGLISSGSAGFANYGTLGLLANTGSISGGPQALYLAGPVGSITNSGRITAPQTAIGIGGSVSSLVNSGFIGNGSTALNVEGTMGTLVNDATGTLGGQTSLRVAGSLGGFSNSGLVTGKIENVTANALTITGGTGTVTGTLTGSNLTNQGSIVNTLSNLVFASGNLRLNDNMNVGSNTVINAGAALSMGSVVSVTGNYSQTGGRLALSGAGKLVVSGAANLAGATIQTDYFSSSNTYLSGSQTWTLVAGGNASAYNGVTIQETAAFDGLALISAVNGNSLKLSIGNDYVGGTYGSITNAGTISGVDYPLYVAAAGNLGSYTNTGMLNGVISGGMNLGSIGLLANTGTIMGAVGFTNFAGASIATLSNLGVMTGDLGATAIVNSGTIGNLLNAQGGGSITALTYSGNLPGTYLGYVVSNSQYGQLALSAPVGTLADFEVATGSTLSFGTTYAGVISGLATVEGQSATLSGSYLQDSVLYNWDLVNVGSDVWNLVVDALVTAPTAQNTTAVNQTAAIAGFAQQFDEGAILDHLSNMRGTSDIASQGLRVSSRNAAASPLSSFVVAKGAMARFGAAGDTDGFDAQATGLTFGAAHQGADTEASLGVFGSMFTSKSSTQMTSDKMQSTGIGLFGDAAFEGGLRVEGYLAYYNQSHDINRILGGYTYIAAPAGRSMNAYGKISSDGVKLGDGISLKPYVALSYTQQSTDAYDEAGIGDAPLHVNADSTWNARTSIGARISKDMPLANGMLLSPSLDAAWIFAAQDGERVVGTRFLGSSDVFGASVAGIDRDYGRITASINLTVKESVNISLDYTADLMNDGQDTQGNVQLAAKLRF